MKQQYLKKIYRKESQLSWDAKDLGRSHSELILSLASQKRGGTPLLQKKKIVLFQDMEVSSGFSDAGTHAFASNESSLSANLDFSQWYAQAGDAVFFDVSSHVSTPYSGDASDSKDFLVHGDQNSVGLSNLAIALLGLAGIGGVVALASSKGSSSSTPDTTAPTVQSLNANATAGTVTLSFSESLDPLHLPLASAFDIRTGVALASNPVSSIEVSGNSLILHLSNSFVSGQISISYLDASSANDVNTIQDVAGNDAQSFVTGTVADGYISGAQIYIDVNGNGIPDVSELLAGVVTDANGNFFLPSNAPLGAIIAVGGINVDTNLAQLTPLKAPIGSLTINPITHLIQSIIDESSLSGTAIDALDAADRVATAFGISLPSGASLLSFNPLAGSSVDGYSLLAQKVAAQISSLTVLSSSGDQGTAFLVINSLADFILSQPNSPVDLSDSADVNQILLPIFSDGASRVADVVAANTAIDNVNSFGEITAEQTTYLSAATQSAIYLAQIQSASALDSNAPNTEVRAMGGSTIIANDLNLGLAGVEGTTDPFTLVHLQLAPGLHKSIYSDSLGEWRYSFSSSDVAYMGQGVKNILCWTVAAAGNRGEVTRVPLLIDTIVPIASLQSRVNETTHELINARSDNDSTPTFNIIAEAASVVKVKDGLGSYKTIGNGTGSAQEYSIGLDAFQGLHKLTFRVLDAAGNYQEQSYDYVLDSIAPQVTMNASAGTINDGAATLISFNFDQAPTAFSASNLEVRGGTMSSLTGSGTTWAGTFTADTDLSTRNASVSIAQGFLHDGVGNASEAATKIIYVVTPLPSISPDLVINADLAKESLIDMIMRLVIVELEKIPFAINLSDVAAYIQDHLYVTLPGNGSFEIHYDANQNDTAFIAIPLDMNLGIPGLNLDVQSTIPLELVLDCVINISGGYDSSGLYLNTSTGANPCVQISAEVSTDEALTVTGTLGPLSISAVNNNTFADVAATIDLSNQEDRFTLAQIIDYASYRIDHNSRTLTTAQIAAFESIDSDVVDQLGLFSSPYFTNHLPSDIVSEVNNLISDRDNRLYWDELFDVISNPENIGRIFDARVDAAQNLSFLIQSEVNTGVGLLDSFIPNFSFIATASATEHGDINAASLTYAADLALTEARITSDVLSDVVVPFLQTTEKVIAPLYPMVDFFHSPLPWQVQTYQNPTSLPSGWDIVNPEAWFDYAKGAAKAGLSSGIDSVIQDLYASIDIDEDGQVQFIEVMQAPVQFGMTILENGEAIIDDLQEVIREIQDSPAASAAEWAAKATLIGAAIGGVVGGALSGSLGTAAAIAISLNADTLLAQTDKIKGDLENLRTLMTNINAGIDALEIVLSKIEDFRTLTQTLTTNEDSGSGITMDGILLGSYGYHIEGGPNGYTVTEGTPNNPTLKQLVESQYIPPSQSSEVPAYTGILADLQNIGIEIPLLTDRNLLGKLISLQPIDLLTYSPDLPTVNLSFESDVDLVAVGQDVANVIQAFGLPGIGEAYTQATKIISIFANLETQFFGSLTLDPNIDFGIDTAGVNSWFTNGMPLDYSGLLYLADGLYASDHLTSANSGGEVVTTDNPEFTISSTLGLSNTLNIGWPFVGGQLDVTTELLGQLLLDVNDPNDDGKLRLSEILANIEGDDPLLNIGDPSYLDFKVSGEGSAWLDFSKPIPVSALKSLGIDSGILNAIADAASWITSAAENRYSLDIPYAAQWRLIGTTSDAVIQI
jgi:hypothetical protein